VSSERTWNHTSTDEEYQLLPAIRGSPHNHKNGIKILVFMGALSGIPAPR
jgi:hypothetical protein